MIQELIESYKKKIQHLNAVIGSRPDLETRERYRIKRAEYRAFITELDRLEQGMCDLMAAVWQEGYDSGSARESSMTVVTNPYKPTEE